MVARKCTAEAHNARAFSSEELSCRRERSAISERCEGLGIPREEAKALFLMLRAPQRFCRKGVGSMRESKGCVRVSRGLGVPWWL